MGKITKILIRISYFEVLNVLREGKKKSKKNQQASHQYQKKGRKIRLYDFMWEQTQAYFLYYMMPVHGKKRNDYSSPWDLYFS